MYKDFLTLFIVVSLFLVYFCRKNNLLVDFKLEKHKRFSSKFKINSIGGILLISFFIYEYLFIDQNFSLLLFLFCIFFIGLMSDVKRLNSVSLRFILQIALVIFFAKIIGLEITSTRIEFLDLILSNNLANVIFVSFCLMVLINGGNFIDGLNGLLIKYFLLIYLVIFFNFDYNINTNTDFLLNFIIVLSLILLLNLCGFIYMGDSGAYLLSLFTGIYLINFSYNNEYISPFLIIVLLWYPCFELLFSMIRRFIDKSETYKPDTSHLHQLVYYFIKKNKFSYKNSIIHFITSLLINSYNLFIFIFAMHFIYNSKVLILMIMTNIFIYVLLYIFLKKKYQMDNQ
ncbi:hypothetical protein [Candidatus Pelagibacter communis]|uniref:hypothetical protein n=1 Tax=Pelagibacter ubique TaxID=198252 RepID=UPI00094C4B62|nr:hypothetical protein [Candidatus Pelagibacter ubique]